MKRTHGRRHGAFIVEFAFTVIILIILLFGMLELGRAVYTWNSAVQATRAGARAAAIAAMGSTPQPVLDAMRVSMPQLQWSDIEVLYSPDGIHFAPYASRNCERGTCVFVQVRIQGEFHPAVAMTPLGRFLPDRLLMPGVATTVPVEALGVT
ncbi:MAG TPA: TadE/TadG family type IV pilus assembly protein [Ramlibacter sp.]|uniref:TadE family protein n=1 Tax=Ramlibacter sp. TaxID=1917967 RepID=UPI002D7F9053|nr:TadE/TadG family type IV pilus assembly protein [Ramlibacter sp.]HET8746399.1 TadE/TadG family type IV pilus assembly protein [Ramlibacter sp.]